MERIKDRLEPRFVQPIAAELCSEDHQQTGCHQHLTRREERQAESFPTEWSVVLTERSLGMNACQAEQHQQRGG